MESLEARDVPAVVFTDTYAWDGVGTVTVTVDDDAPGYAGLYHWNYRVANTSFADGGGVGKFAVSVGDPADVSNLGSSVGWFGYVGVLSGDPNLVHWEPAGAGEGSSFSPPAGSPIPVGQSADFWFTTSVTAVHLRTGFVTDTLFTTQKGGPVAAPAPSLLVTTAQDINDAFDGEQSLREAIAVANGPTNLAGVQRIGFKSTLAGATITLNPNAPTYGQLTLRKNVFIDGEDRGITIRRDPGTAVNHRIFELFDANVSAKLKGLTLRNGKVEGEAGGAVLSRGTLTVESCVFAQNQAVNSRGGAIATVAAPQATTLTVIGSTFTGNNAARGGAIYIDERVSTLISSTSLVLNTATASGDTQFAYGGGIYIRSSTTTVPTTVTLNAVDVNGNSAYTAGGGIYVFNSGGAGLGTWLILNGGTTVQNNQVTIPSGQGGGIYFGKGTITFNWAWVGSNTATQGDGMYHVTGTNVQIGNPGVTWYDDQVLEGP